MNDRSSVASDLAVARRRAWALTPYSPPWDAAMSIVEELERVLWQIDHPRHGSDTERGRGEVVLEPVSA